MGNSSYRGKFQRNFDQGKANLVDLAENSSYRGYCSTVLNSPESDRVIRYKAYSCKIPLSICNNDYSHVSSKQKGTNKWFSMHLELSCSYRKDL